MLPEITQIRQKRLQLGWTQQKLAKQANVSQSLIAKIERGLIDPTYSRVTQLFQALENTQTVEKIMNTKVMFVKPETTKKRIIALMSEHDISQFPIIENKKCIGIITQRALLEEGNTAKELMEPAPLMVKPSADVELVKTFLQHDPRNCVLVVQLEKVVGIVTPMDLVN